MLARKINATVDFSGRGAARVAADVAGTVKTRGAESEFISDADDGPCAHQGRHFDALFALAPKHTKVKIKRS
jgi:hypothetical protein